jgi:hypothetical protein
MFFPTSPGNPFDGSPMHQVPDKWGEEPSFADRLPHQFPAIYQRYSKNIYMVQAH